MKDYQKEAKELLEKHKSEYSWKYYDEIMQFLIDYQSEKADLEIVDCDLIDDIVSYRLEMSGYQGVICLLDGISNNMNQSYYRIDGYGNLETIEDDDIECWLDDIANDRM